MKKNLLLLICLFAVKSTMQAQSSNVTTTSPSRELTNKRIIIDNIETKTPENTPILEQTAPLNAVVRQSANSVQEAKTEKSDVKIER